MCGLAGFTGFDNKRELAMYANDIQKHRGPDHQEIWYDNYIALAHQRLSIIDLSSSANQPMHKRDLVIIFNGEIYNYKSLKRDLEKTHGVHFKTQSDTEVVLEMYAKHGSNCLDQLIGMFALAIYNKKTRHLFIARDHFGIKPLFYTKIGENFAFSSELKTLVGCPGFNQAINPKSLVSSLNYVWVSGSETMFKNCHKLPPAHFLELSPQSQLTVKKYWDLNSSTGPRLRSADEVAQIMENSISRHMIADVPVSSFLSGGLDSSLISVVAKKHNPQLSTYTIGTNSEDKRGESMPDDEKYANTLADTYGFDHHVIRITPDILKELPKMVWSLDEPIGDPAAINTYLICKAARNKGVKVLLSGMGADEIFFGYRRQKATMLALKYNKLPDPVKKVIRKIVEVLPVKIGATGFKLGRWAKRFITFTDLPVDETYMKSYSYYSDDEFRDLLKPDYWKYIDQIKIEHSDVFNSGYIGDTVNQICHTDINMFMLGLNLTYSDRASMAASVEVRVPFIDRDVITKAMQIPGSLKFSKRRSKYILKKAAEKYLPKSIIYRPKASFGAPIRSWISGDLRPLVDELLSEKNIKRRGFFNYPFIKKMIDDDRKGVRDNAYQLYQLLTLELWFRQFVDREKQYSDKKTTAESIV